MGSPWFELWKVLAHKKHQETICGTEVVSFCLMYFHCTCIEFCADYWWNQRTRPRDHRKLLRFAQIPKAKRRKVCRQAIRKDGSLEFSVKIGGFWMILSEQPHHEHPPAHRYTLSYIRWRKDLLVESNWGGMVKLGLFDWLIHSFIPVPFPRFPLPQTEAQPATMDTNSTATACLSGASGDLDVWYLMIFAIFCS